MKPVYAALAALLILAAPAEAAEPLTLVQAIERAMAAHPDILAAEVAARNAVLGLEDARARNLQLSAGVAGLGRRAQTGVLAPTGLGPTQDIAAVNTNLEVSVPLFNGFKLANNVKAAEFQGEASIAGLRQAASRLRLSVSQSFWNLRRAERLGLENDAAIAAATQALALVKARHKLGTATLLDVNRAEVELLTTRGDMLAQVATISDARARLAALLGVGPTEVAIAEPELEAPPPDPPRRTATSAPHRVVAQEASLQAATASAEAAKGDRWPQIGLVSAYQHGNNPFNPASGVRGIDTTFSGTWDVRLSLGYNLFDMGLVNRTVERAENDRKLAAADAERIKREVATDQALADVKLATAHERLRVAEAGATLAQSTVSFAQARWTQGYASLLEVLDARRALLKARNQRVEARYDVLIAVAELLYARGDL